MVEMHCFAMFSVGVSSFKDFPTINTGNIIRSVQVLVANVSSSVRFLIAGVFTKGTRIYVPVSIKSSGHQILYRSS